MEFQKRISSLQNRYVDFEYKVPEIIPELSSNKILARAFASGVTLKQWINTNPDEKSKVKIATALLDLYFLEFFQWGLVQTDPNSANFKNMTS